MIKYNTRFAPSPNGYLHLGHAYSALISSELAKKTGGKFFLRIEDIDLGRCKKKFEDSIFKDLNWLKIKYEKNLIKQSEHFAKYEKYIKKLSKEHIDYFIFGHRHLPIVHQLKTKSKYINLGDWITHFTYGVFDGKTCTLRNFLKKND